MTKTKDKDYAVTVKVEWIQVVSAKNEDAAIRKTKVIFKDQYNITLASGEIKNVWENKHENKRSN